MKPGDVSRVAVIGCGTMGNGIAHVFAQAGYEVSLIDIVGTIEKNLSRMVKREKISEDDKRATLGRIAVGTDLEAAKTAQLVVEAATENPGIKFDIFRRLDADGAPETKASYSFSVSYRG